MSAVNALLNKLRLQLGDDVIPSDHAGVFSLSVDGQNIALDCTASQDSARLFGRIGMLPDDEILLKKFLSANLFLENTAGAVFCLDKTKNDLCLWKEIQADGMSAASFITCLNQFASQMSQAQLNLLNSGAATAYSIDRDADAGDDFETSMGNFIRV